MRANKQRQVVLALSFVFLFTFGVQAAPRYDLGGVTVKTLLFGGLIDMWDAPEMLDRRAEVERDFNVKLEFEEVVWGQYPQTVMRRVLSGDAEWDFYRLTLAEVHDLTRQGALLPLDDYMSADLEARIPEFSQAFMDFTLIEGNRYGYLGSFNLIDMIKYIGYNKDMFEAVGLDDPYQLYLADQWDWEAFTEAAKVLTADTTGDGALDRWAIDMIMEEDLVVANNGRYAREIEGKVVFTGDEPAVIEALVQNDEWINAGYYRGWGPEAFADGEIGMMFLEMWRLRDHVNPNTGEWKIDFELGIVPFPKGPSADRNIYPTETILYYCLPSNSGNPEAMVALLDALYPAEAIFEEAEEAFMEWAPSREAFGVLMESVVEWDGWIDIYQPMLAPWTPGDQTWSAYMAAVKQAKQAILDDLFNK